MVVKQATQIRLESSSTNSSIRKLLSAFNVIEKCPDPTFDTGCTHCQPQLPKDKRINFDMPLNGTKPKLWKHLLIHTNEVDGSKWPSRIELDPNSLAANVYPLRRQIQSPFHPILVSNIALETYFDPNRFKVMLFPDNRTFYIEKESIQLFTELYLNPKIHAHEVKGISWESNLHETILICGHSQRDERCGIIAPLLKREFEIVLDKEGLLYNLHENPRGIKVGIISHIGGHAYAGNVVYFTSSGQSIWYGRVFPNKVQGIVNQTVKKNTIIKELYRGKT